MSAAPWRRLRPRRSVRADSDDAGARRAFFNGARSLTGYLSVEARGLTFLVSTNDRLGRGLFVRRWRQDFRHLERAVRILKEEGLLKPDSVFVDVGANIGTTTVRAIRRHRFSRAVALEPEPGNFRTLRLNLVANDVDSLVVPLRVAVADREGEVHLAVSARSSGEHTIVPQRPDEHPDERIAVEAVTLDALAQRGVIEPDRVGLLWLDAHGAEALALRGATSLLERGVPVVTALRPELPNWGETKALLVRLLGGYGAFADLRHARGGPVDQLEPLLAALTANADVLAFRR